MPKGVVSHPLNVGMSSVKRWRLADADHADQSCLREVVARRRDDPVRPVARRAGLQPGLGPADQDADVARRRDGGRDPHLGLARASGSLRAEILRRHRAALRRTIPVLFQETRDKRIKSFLEARGFDVTELPDRREQTIGGVRVICGVSEFYDSWLHLTDGTGLDPQSERLRRGRRRGAARDRAADRPVDVLLTQFSYAAWKGGRAERAFPQARRRAQARGDRRAGPCAQAAPRRAVRELRLLLQRGEFLSQRPRQPARPTPPRRSCGPAPSR